MKYIVIILIALSIILIGCEPVLNADTVPVTLPPETVVITQVVTNTEYIEIENTEKIDELELQLEQYKSLIANLNDLLSNVYYGYAENDKYILDGFTAFSLAYNDKFYIITAGHCVENEYGKFSNFKFKANFSDEWIYPKLLGYESDYPKIDYAIFLSDKILSGLKISTDEINRDCFVLGYDCRIRDIGKPSIAGESGSPIIDEKGSVAGILTGLTPTPIILVLNAIDKI